MPTDTFYNLNEEKRNRIIQAAIKEFSIYAYDDSNISNIVNNACIARGSFYQYFEDKEDLYIYILTMVTNEKVKYLSPILAEIETKNFFEVFGGLYKAGFEFARKNPQYYKIGDLFLKRPNASVKDKLYSLGMKESDSFFISMIEKGKERGELRKDMDTELMAHFIYAINFTLGEELMKKCGLYEEERIQKFVEQLIEIIKNGIATPR